MTKIKDVAETLERFAPLPLQESYDNAGLQIGLTLDENVSGVLLCLDVTEEIIDEAYEYQCNLIVAHHPLIFRPLRHITQQTQVERCVCAAIKKDIAVYAAHTNLDNAPDGVNFKMGEKLGLTHVRFLDPRSDGRGGSGLFGSLLEPLPSQTFLSKVADTFGVECLCHNQPEQKLITTVAICGGAGDFLLGEAIRQGADAFITGEMDYHHYFGHEEEILIAVTGHYQSEQYTSQLLRHIIEESHPSLRIVETKVNTNPIHYLSK